MVGAVQTKCKLDTKGKNGVTLRQRLLAELSKTKSPRDRSMLVARLKEPTIPPAGRKLWRWFWSLRSRVEASNRIPITEIDAWERVHRLAPSPIELGILDAMDAEFVAMMRPLYDGEKPEADMAPATTDSVKRVFKGLLAFRKKKK